MFVVELPEQWASCFWSYVRGDDEALRGKIDQIREDLIGYYAAETGERLEIFQDRVSIGWGEEWQDALGLGVSRTVFFVPVVTPNYFKSDACRRELLDFHQLCQARGISGLILPIIISRPDLIDVDSDDEVVRIIANSNYESFVDVWPASRDSERWMTAVRDLARKLVAAERRVEEQLPEILASEIRVTRHRGGDDDAAPDGLQDQRGIIEIVEDFGPAGVAATTAVENAVSDLNLLAALVGEFGEKSAQVGDDQAAYKAVILEMAKKIEAPTRSFVQSASLAQRQVLEADALIKELREIIAVGNQSDVLAMYQNTFNESLRGLSDVAPIATLLDELARQMADVEKISVILRTSLRPARQAVLMLGEAARTVAAWAPPES